MAAPAGRVFEVGTSLFPAPQALDGRLQRPFLIERQHQHAVFGHDDGAVADTDGEHRHIRHDQIPVLVVLCVDNVELFEGV